MANQVYDLLSSVRRWGQGSGCTCPHRIQWTSLIDESFLFGREFSSGKRRTGRMRGESSTVWGVSSWWNVRLMNGLPTISDEMDQRCCFPVLTQLITELLAGFSPTWFLLLFLCILRDGPVMSRRKISLAVPTCFPEFSSFHPYPLWKQLVRWGFITWSFCLNKEEK
jgi:hypothetical protein